MARRFTPKIPKKPLFKRKSYEIPSNYLEVYKSKSIVDDDEQMMLFYLTQFGGFRFKEIPEWVRSKNEFMSHWFKTKRESGFYHFRANQEFLSNFGDIGLVPLRKIWRNDVLKDNEMREYGFSDDDCKESREFLKALNEFYSTLRIEIPTPASGITLEDRVNLVRFHGIPFLVKKPRAGGRFFHPGSSFQRIESTLRQGLTINGEKTSEIDLSAATLQFLGIVLGDSSPMEKILSYQDPYQYFLDRVDLDVKRDDIKPFVYTAVFCDKKHQKGGVTSKARLFLGEGYSYNRLVSIFPHFFKALDILKSEFDFPPHVVIFKEESKYAQRVLEIGCLKLGLPIMPIHDSFITTVGNISRLRRIINNASEELYNKRLSYKVKY